MSGYIQCPNCHNEVSINADECPFCGEPIQKIVVGAYKKFYIKFTISALILGLLLIVSYYYTSVSYLFTEMKSTIIAILLWIILIIGVVISFIICKKAFKEGKEKIASLIIQTKTNSTAKKPAEIVHRKKNKKLISLLISTGLLVLFIIFLFSDYSAAIFNNREYKAYKYAIECVEDDLKFPETATYPSFKETTIKKSQYGTEILLDSYVGGKDFDYAWDISGSGTCENSFGMTMNYRFTVTVVFDEYGDMWCYKCIID